MKLIFKGSFVIFSLLLVLVPFVNASVTGSGILTFEVFEMGSMGSLAEPVVYINGESIANLPIGTSTIEVRDVSDKIKLRVENRKGSYAKTVTVKELMQNNLVISFDVLDPGFSRLYKSKSESNLKGLPDYVFKGQEASEKTVAMNTPKSVAPVTSIPEVKEKEDLNRYGVAVVVGNKSYQSSGAGIPDVDYAHNDADAIYRYVVEELGFREGNVILLKDATQAQMFSVFGSSDNPKGKLYNWTKDGKSDIFVYYSGHGAPGISNGKGYLLPVNSDPMTVELNGYPLERLYKNLSQIPARSMTVVLDACFSGSSQSGTVVKGASSIALKVVKPQQVIRNAAVLTAADVNEVASWDNDARMGLFTSYFLKGVGGAADGPDFGDQDGVITLGELKGFLQEEVTYMARREFFRGQHPQVTGEADLELVEYK